MGWGSRGGVSINTVSVKAQGLSDPPVNFKGVRGHQRGQRAEFMLITNNALFCTEYREKTVTTGCSYEPEYNYAKASFMTFSSIYCCF